jgi:hypothetical protein
LKPAWANTSETLSGKNPSQKRAGGVAQVWNLSSNPSTAKKRKPFLLSTSLPTYAAL